MRSRTGMVCTKRRAEGRGVRRLECSSVNADQHSHVTKTRKKCRSPSARVARGRPLVARAPAQTQQVHLCMPPEVQGSARGGGRGTQAAGTHTQTHNCRDLMAGAHHHHHHHHPTTRAPSQSSVSVNGPQTTRAVRKVARLRFVRERGAGWRAWRWRRGSDWQLSRANHQAPTNRAGAHNLPCSGGSQVTWLPCLVCAKRGTMPEGGHPACRDREGDAATEATEATGGDGKGAVGTLV